MMRKVFTPLLVCGLVGLVGALAGCHPHDIDLMKIQPKYRPYSENDFFSDTRAMRTPPEDTIPRERIVDPAIAMGVGPDGKYLDHSPVPITKDMLALGQKRFDITCAACHGRLGDGRSVVATKMSLRPPPTLLSPLIEHMPDGQLYRIVAEGYGLMPPYAAEINQRERWAVVAYVRALEMSQNVPLAEAPPDEQARLRGEEK